MQINNLKQLDAHIKKNGIPAISLIGSDEPFLKDQARSIIINAAKSHHYDITREQIHGKFNWSEFLAINAQADLFSSKKLLDISHPKGGFSTADYKAISQFLDTASTDCCILISTDKPSAQQKKSKTYQLISAHGLTMQFYPLKPAQLEQWIIERARHFKLNMTKPVLQLLIQASDGRLTPAEQTLKKLALMHYKHAITIPEMQAALTDHSEFNHFELIDYALLGKSTQVKQLLDGLKQTRAEPTLILWSFSQALRTLQSMQTSQKTNGSPQQAIAKQWPERRQAFMQAYQRINQSPNSISDFFYFTQRIDLAIKGASLESAWTLISNFAQALCQPTRHQLL